MICHDDSDILICKTVFRWLVRSRRSLRTVLTLRIWRLSTKTWHFWEVSLKHGSQGCGRSFPGTNGTSAGKVEMKRRPRMEIMTFRAGMVASPPFSGALSSPFVPFCAGFFHRFAATKAQSGRWKTAEISWIEKSYVFLYP